MKLQRCSIGVIVTIGAFCDAGCLASPASTRVSCERIDIAKLSIDKGHRWRPPFGLDRVGSPPVAHVELHLQHPPTAEYYLTAYNNGDEIEREKVHLRLNAGDYGGLGNVPISNKRTARFSHVILPQRTTEAALERGCDGKLEVLDRKTVTKEDIEADAVAQSPQPLNPVDFGAIFPPHNVLFIVEGQDATVRVAALSRSLDLPRARLQVWVEGAKPIEQTMSLLKDKRVDRTVTVPVSSAVTNNALRIRILNEEKIVWSKDISVMTVRHWMRRPLFGVVQTKLHYGSAIPVFDSNTGSSRAALPYETAWNADLKDLIVFLPNGSRFVFWRGANYIPFWAGQYNTGTLYQWAEDCSRGMISHPDGSKDCPEPLFDTELRYSRARIIEASAARIHVRWEYELTDVRYEVRGGLATEDFYFYPDGFGTRVVTVTASADSKPQLSEFIIITPASAYPLEVLPKKILKALYLNSGQKDNISFPYDDEASSVDNETQSSKFTRLILRDHEPTLFRIFSHKDDPSSAIYLYPDVGADFRPLMPYAYPPMYDGAEIVTPAYWGNHWPLTRGKWTGWTINDEIDASPTHSAIAGWIPFDPQKEEKRWEVAPLVEGKWAMANCTSSPQPCVLSRFAWMIGHTDLPDQELIRMGRSFTRPPAIDVFGGRVAVPSYSIERRALRIVAEQPRLTIRLRPTVPLINPVFEIEEAPTGPLEFVFVNEVQLSPTEYAWDGKTLWLNRNIEPPHLDITLSFK
ncbi:hypothetical protein JM946_29605 [Steroidobacter sp. S1-65]|uniref:Uncharacterized protein n=1 Tax=Steroidobacter gossypii TaxID=2805490 RepID=A0ABS1X6Q3_9GAMM|nr:hypothetical protein [Steroidobacter gossypii]MBM0108905.1 hypothetical protein [Steroidobacter gossypii]